MLLGLISRLPLPVLYACFGLVAWLLRVLRWRRHLVDRCLARCFPEQGATERRRLAGNFYAGLGRVAAEILHGAQIGPADLDARVRFENPEVVLEALASGRRVLLLAAHHCNWEWLLLACSRGFGEPLVAPYKPVSVASADRWGREMRSRFGATMVPAKGLVAHLLARRGQVRLLAMLADQSPRGDSEHQRWLPFFGEETSFFRGPGQIAARMGFDPLFVAMSPAGRGRYTVRFVPLAQAGERLDAEQVLCAYVRALERQILEHPAQYFWAYNRWKRPKSLYE
jgi:KDO2-lipid IV(A) lauroyltransferase